MLETVVHYLKFFFFNKEKKKQSELRHELLFSNAHHIKKKSGKALGHPLLPAVSQIAFLETSEKYFCRRADSVKEKVQQQSIISTL